MLRETRLVSFLPDITTVYCDRLSSQEIIEIHIQKATFCGERQERRQGDDLDSRQVVAWCDSLLTSMNIPEWSFLCVHFDRPLRLEKGKNNTVSA